jgi:DDE superfamily endonuclease
MHAPAQAPGLPRFLRNVERSVEPGLDIPVILDNYATHKHETVRAWLERPKRVHLHFVPTGASWLNMVERLYAHRPMRTAHPAMDTGSHERFCVFRHGAQTALRSGLECAQSRVHRALRSERYPPCRSACAGAPEGREIRC